MNTTLRITVLSALLGVASLTFHGCAVQRGQESVGAYVDDATITAQVKSRFIDSKLVDASAISVETMTGTVLLSGFAKNPLEKTTAEHIARQVRGVRSVKNEIALRP
ncbi:MAG: BON domain-containing protein [Rhodoferax sp.]|nr:BON domain-containing protein [Rhodoferax sp.]